MVGHIRLRCRCGRSLRVAEERAGTTIRCWSCRAEMTAPRPGVRAQLARELADDLRGTARPERLGPILAASLVLVAALAVPRVGPVIALALLILAALRARTALRRTVGWTLAGASRYPLTTLGAVLVLPLGLLLAEGALVGLSYQQGWLPYLVLDLAPPSATAAVFAGRPEMSGAQAVDFSEIPARTILRVYGHGLRRGRTLLGAIPASLGRGTAPRRDTGYALLDPLLWEQQVDTNVYLAARLGYSLLIAAGVLSMLALQGRWVRRIGTLDARRMAARVAQSHPALPWVASTAPLRI